MNLPPNTERLLPPATVVPGADHGTSPMIPFAPFTVADFNCANRSAIHAIFP